METINRKMAIFTTTHGSLVECGEWAVGYDGYTQLTEFLEVEFKKLPDSVTIAAQLDEIQKQETKARQQFQMVLNELENRRGKLLALTHAGE